MATKLFLHDALNVLNNLPPSEQSSLTSADDFDGQAETRSMDTTIGGTQRSI